MRKDEVLVELETDKVSLEVVSPSDGVLSEIRAADGATVTPGAVLGVVSEGASAAPAAEAPKAETPKTEAASALAAEPAPAAPSVSGGTVPIMTPTMGESVAEGSMGTWLKKSGDTVARDEMLVEIETDKVAVEVSAPPPAS